MSDPQNPKAKPGPPASDAKQTEQSDGQSTPKDYYYDDSTGYEIYEDRDDEDLNDDQV